MKRLTALQLFSKILRTADAQAKETHHASDADRSPGEGRSQVMNLLTIDTNTIASLATIAPNVTNSIISRMAVPTLVSSKS